MTEPYESAELLKLRFDNVLAMMPADRPCRVAFEGWFQTIYALAVMTETLRTLAEQLEEATGRKQTRLITIADRMSVTFRESASAAESAIMESL